MSQVAAKSPQRGRPRSQRKHREIMLAAIDLFTRHGYDGVSVDDIAAAAGVSKQTVYTHFGSKENLFGLAVSTKCKDSGIDPDEISLDVPPQAMLPRIARDFLQLVMSPGASRVYAVCTGSAETQPELGRLFFRHGPQQTVEAVARYLSAQHRAGTLDVPDPEAAAWQFLGMLKGEAQMRVQFRLEPLAPATLERYVDSCVAMFLRAYGPRRD